ncbi:MAG: hypothetical protein [Inoviridae sp.]|nr:MAG: hypothetical protein [Inoviridae sp.]
MLYMNMVARYYPTVFFVPGSGTPASGSLTAILSAATELVTWIITTMGSYLNFVTSNPVVLMMFLILLAGTGIAFLLRLWHSA